VFFYTTNQSFRAIFLLVKKADLLNKGKDFEN
jgi:hypothetical protein